jgi:hypothetical protein
MNWETERSSRCDTKDMCRCIIEGIRMMTRISRLRFTGRDYTIRGVKMLNLETESVRKETLLAVVEWLKDEMDEWEHFCPGCGDDISRFEPHHIHPNCKLSRATQDLESLAKELK